MLSYKLKFHSALHVDSKGSGEAAVADETIHSDTLSAAIALSWHSLYPKDSDKIFYDLPFKVSSAFPYLEDILFFPIPQYRIWPQDINPSKYKELKKVKWVSSNLFEQIRNKGMLSIEDVKFFSCGLALSKEEYQSREYLKDLKAWEIRERQRVSVDRLGSKEGGDTFFFALQFFSPESGLFFLAETEEKRKLSAVLDFLGDSGLGADRNSGLGHFEVKESEPFSFQEISNDAWITLSLFNPGSNDDLKTLTNNTAYGLLTRSGWISNSTVGRPPIRVFSEGSVFSDKPEGRIIELLPQSQRQRYSLNISHGAARDFRAISVSCSQPEEL